MMPPVSLLVEQWVSMVWIMYIVDMMMVAAIYVYLHQTSAPHRWTVATTSMELPMAQQPWISPIFLQLIQCILLFHPRPKTTIATNMTTIT